MPLIPDPRSQLAKNFREGMDLTDIMPGGMGMAAKMSSPAVDVLSRWIRRFRKDKPPTVPLKNIEKALKHEYQRRTDQALAKKQWDAEKSRLYTPPIERDSYMGPENLPVPGQPAGRRRREAFVHRPLGVEGKDPFEDLWDFVQSISKGSPRPPYGYVSRHRTPREVFSEELERKWRKK